jgi:hypothetical protein
MLRLYRRFFKEAALSDRIRNIIKKDELLELSDGTPEGINPALLRNMR